MPVGPSELMSWAFMPVGALTAAGYPRCTST